jgi:hypothetical protein
VDKPMFEDYRLRQSDWFVRPIVRALMREISSRPEEDVNMWKAALAAARRTTCSLELLRA